MGFDGLDLGGRRHGDVGNVTDERQHRQQIWRDALDGRPPGGWPWSSGPRVRRPDRPRKASRNVRYEVVVPSGSPRTVKCCTPVVASASLTRRLLPLPVLPTMVRTASLRSPARRRASPSLLKLRRAARRRGPAGPRSLESRSHRRRHTLGRAGTCPSRRTGSTHERRREAALGRGCSTSRRASPLGAALISRAARFTVSPMTVYVARCVAPIVPAKTWPSLTPICNGSGREASSDRSAVPAAGGPRGQVCATRHPAHEDDLSAVLVDVAGQEATPRPRLRPRCTVPTSGVAANRRPHRARLVRGVRRRR